VLAMKKVNPVNSILFVSDLNGGSPPTPVRGSMILATSSCISFCCYPEQDGPTEVILGVTGEVDPGGQHAFDGDLETPNRAVIVSTVEGETVLEAKVLAARTRIRIWLSHPRWPDKVSIGFG
jgi:hypothetical protein